MYCEGDNPLNIGKIRMYRAVIIFSIIWAQIAGQCRFPDKIQGRWYQYGLGEVVIRERDIDKKGACKENHSEFYLVHNRQSHCYQCLLIMQRHQNIIQYKESYCLDGESLDMVCRQIRVEAILYTLVREGAHPVRCPFEDAYRFQYNNNTGGVCRNRDSYVRACASDAKFRFEFRHCEYAAYTYNQDMDFECLATWKDGSDLYMYGGFTGPGITQRDNMYKCFMYDMFGTVVHLAMSADATCRGLRSPRDGPMVMEFDKDTMSWPTPSCRFPDWFTQVTWQDLSAQHLFVSDDFGEVIKVSYRRHPHSVPHTKYAFRCMRVDLLNTTRDKFVAVSYSSHDCENKFQCVMIVRRHDNVVEIHKGAFVSSQTHPCHEIHFQNAKIELLMPRNLPGVPCPFTGRYYILPDSSGCQLDVRSGCNRTSQIQIMSSCVARPVGNLECLHTWKENHKKYVIARKLGDVNSVANCFSFRTRGDTIEFSTDRKCNNGARNLFDDPIKYTMSAHPANCEDEIEAKILPPPEEKPLSQQEHHSYDAGYKHTGNDNTAHKDYYDDHRRDTTTYQLNSAPSCSHVTLPVCFFLFIAMKIFER